MFAGSALVLCGAVFLAARTAQAIIDGRLRKGLFGLPAEAIGFSRDARVRIGPPSFEKAAIDIAEPTTNTRLRLRHLGP